MQTTSTLDISRWSPWLYPDRVLLDTIRATFPIGSRVIYQHRYCSTRWGRVDHIARSGFVSVTLYSPRLERFVYGAVTYAPTLLRPMRGEK